MSVTPKTEGQLFYSMCHKVSIDSNNCWNWLGYTSPFNGYGQVWFNKANHRVHRLMYQFIHGLVPKGKVIDHLCRNRACCNPEHMEAVTQKLNTHRGVGLPGQNIVKTHCPKGHEYTPENTRMSKNKRHCKECGRAAYRKWYHKERGIDLKETN